MWVVVIKLIFIFDGPKDRKKWERKTKRGVVQHVLALCAQPFIVLITLVGPF